MGIGIDLVLIFILSYLSMSLGKEEAKGMKWKGGVERVEAKEKVSTRFFLRAARKMPGNPGKKEELEGSREVGGEELIMHV